jgi:hypothetical protein
MYVPNRKSNEQSESTHAAHNLVKIITLIVRDPCPKTRAHKHEESDPPRDWSALYVFVWGVFGDGRMQSVRNTKDHTRHQGRNADRT